MHGPMFDPTEIQRMEGRAARHRERINEVERRRKLGLPAGGSGSKLKTLLYVGGIVLVVAVVVVALFAESLFT